MNRFKSTRRSLFWTKAVTVVFLTTLLLTLSPAESSYSLQYDFEGHWAEQSVRYWIEKGYLSMYADGTFRPDEPVTRAEFVVMVNRLFDLQSEGDLQFLDVQPGDWYDRPIRIGSKAGYITGQEDGSFYPNRPILREEAATMLGRLMTIPAELSPEEPDPVRDLRFASPYAHPYIRTLLDLKVLQGFGDRMFRPEQPLTRAEAVVLLERIATWTDRRPVFYEDHVAVLMYHSVRADYDHDHCIHEEVFARHVQMLQTSGFAVISQERFERFMEGRSGVPPNAVLITFDDGYEDFYHLAYPRLQEYSMPATMFMITSTIGDKDGWNPKIDALQMDEMGTQGISFQSHSHDAHRYIEGPNGKEDAFLVTRVRLDDGALEDPQQYMARITKDLQKSKQILDTLRHQDTLSLAVPYGRTSPEVNLAAGEAGFSLLFTIRPGIVTGETEPLRIPRINAGYSSISEHDLKNTILRSAR